MRINPDTLKRVIIWIILSLLAPLSITLCYFLGHRGLSDCFLIPGVVYLAIALFAFIIRKGTFDVFFYQFGNLIDSFRKGSPKRYENAGDYKFARQRQRQASTFCYLPFLILGSVFLICSIIFAFVL